MAVRFLAALPSRTRMASPAASFSFASAKVVHSCSVSDVYKRQVCGAGEEAYEKVEE